MDIPILSRHAWLTALAFAFASTSPRAGPLPQPITFPVPISQNDFVSITAGDNHTCARKANGNTYCWGLDTVGQVGVASTATCVSGACVDRPHFVMVTNRVDAGADHNCALDPNGAAWCWGDSNYGQLGNGSYGFQSQPVAVSGGIAFWSLSAGTYSTCGTSASGIWCWGAIANSQGGMPQPALAFSNNTYQSISVGYLQACAVAVTGAGFLTHREADCWGQNSYGQAGVDPASMPVVAAPTPSTFASPTAVAAQSYYTCADQASGIVQCFGYNGWGQLGNGSYTGSSQAQTVGNGMALHGVSTGANHACALDTTGAAWCWGNGNWGELGNGSSNVSPSPQPVGGGHLYRAIAAGGQHTCAIGTDNHLYCWGSNHAGQLGTQYPGGWVSSPVQALDP